MNTESQAPSLERHDFSQYSAEELQQLVHDPREEMEERAVALMDKWPPVSPEEHAAAVEELHRTVSAP